MKGIKLVELPALLKEDDEMRNLEGALHTMKLLREKYYNHNAQKTLKVLKASYVLQQVDKELKEKISREIKKFSLINEIIEFEWVLINRE